VKCFKSERASACEQVTYRQNKRFVRPIRDAPSAAHRVSPRCSDFGADVL